MEGSASKEIPVGIGTVLARASLCAAVAALAACAHQTAPPATPPSQKSHHRPFAGTTNVPQRRAVKGEEMTPAIALRAREILDANGAAAYGTEVPFEIDGQCFIGRIEEHYHEPGGPRRPWGRHRGVTVYHAE